MRAARSGERLRSGSGAVRTGLRGAWLRRARHAPAVLRRVATQRARQMMGATDSAPPRTYLKTRGAGPIEGGLDALELVALGSSLFLRRSLGDGLVPCRRRGPCSHPSTQAPMSRSYRLCTVIQSYSSILSIRQCRLSNSPICCTAPPSAALQLPHSRTYSMA